MVNLLSANVPVIVDIVVVLLILLFGLFGFARGFLNSFVKTFGTIISLVVAALLCATVVNFLNDKFALGAMLADKLSPTINSIFGEGLMALPIESASESTFANSGVAGWIITSVLQIKGAGEYPVGTTIGVAVSQIFAYYLLSIMVFIVLFVILKLICFLITKFAIKLQKRKLIGIGDRFFGLAFGLVKGILFVQFLLLIIQIIPIGFVQQISIAIDGSLITNFISDYNVYALLINAIKSNVII